MRAFEVQQRNTKLPSAYLAVSELPERPEYDKRRLLTLILNTDKSDVEIAELTNYSVNHVARTRRLYGKYKKFVVHHTQDDALRVRELCQQGKSVKEISEETGFCTNFIRKVTVDIRLLQKPVLINSCAKRVGMQPFAYITLKRLEALVKTGQVKPWDLNDAKTRLPSGDVSPQILEWMLKTGRVINICPVGERLSAYNKKAYAKEQEELKKDKFQRRRRFNQWRS